jgi:hypothetical protein
MPSLALRQLAGFEPGDVRAGLEPRFAYGARSEAAVFVGDLSTAAAAWQRLQTALLARRPVLGTVVARTERGIAVSQLVLPLGRPPATCG